MFYSNYWNDDDDGDDDDDDDEEEEEEEEEEVKRGKDRDNEIVMLMMSFVSNYFYPIISTLLRIHRLYHLLTHTQKGVSGVSHSIDGEALVLKIWVVWENTLFVLWLIHLHGLFNAKTILIEKTVKELFNPQLGGGIRVFIPLRSRCDQFMYVMWSKGIKTKAYLLKF